MNDNDFLIFNHDKMNNKENDEQEFSKKMANAIFSILKNMLIFFVMLLLITLISFLTSCSTTKRITDITSDSVKIETHHQSEIKDSASTSSSINNSNVQATNHISNDSTIHHIQDSVTTMLIVDQTGKIIGKEVSKSHYDYRDHYKNTENDNIQNKTSDNKTTVVISHQSNTKDSSDSSSIHKQSHEQIATAPKLSFWQSLKTKLRIISVIFIIAFIVGIIVAIKHRSFLSRIYNPIATFVRKIISHII